MTKPTVLFFATLLTAALLPGAPDPAAAPPPKGAGAPPGPGADTATPIRHLVVIFQENVSFDHYFGTYPHAANPPGSPRFTALPDTPSVNGLTPELLAHNPNAANPRRLDRAQAVTDDMDHGYAAEQRAFDGGRMDRFVEETNGGDWPFPKQSTSMVMNYYDGNTVTALWNYAQHFAMSDNSYGTVFGPSTPGALNLVAGQTAGATAYRKGKPSRNVRGYVVDGTVIGDADPYYDRASNPRKVQVSMNGRNVGDLLNAKGVLWGWFQGGFRDPRAKHRNVAGIVSEDYNPHHQPFQYYESTANPKHLPPTGPIGTTDQANHQYDLKDFWNSVEHGAMPAVCFLKAANYQDGHAGYSDPLDEQNFLVDTVNRLEKSPAWKETAVVIAYDDSDGWYDHQCPPIVNRSNDPALDTPMVQGEPGALGAANHRAGYGPRLPLLVISPYARRNCVVRTVSDQSSILRFIEDNWKLGRLGAGSFDAIAKPIDNLFDFESGPVNPPLFLDPITGLEVAKPDGGLKLVVNGERVFGDAAPFIDKQGCPFVAAATLGHALGHTVRWDGADRAVLVDTEAFPSGVAESGAVRVVPSGVVAPVRARLRGFRAYVPAPEFARTLGATAAWNAKSRTLTVTSR